MGYQSEHYVCDGCGIPKRDVNNWWSIILRRSAMNNVTGSIVTNVMNNKILDSSDGMEQVNSFLVVPFQHEFSKLEDVKCVCGQQCALKFLNTYMSNHIDSLNETVNPDFYVSDLI